jgi:biotin carboxyl carrier protein
MAREEIRAPAMGSVWSVNKAVGDTAAANEDILVLESMKMEIGVQSASGGSVVAIHVAEGDVVEEDQVVAVIETP